MNKYFEIKNKDGGSTIVPFKSVDNITVYKEYFALDTKEEYLDCKDFKQLANYKTWLNKD